MARFIPAVVMAVALASMATTPVKAEEVVVRRVVGYETFTVWETRIQTHATWVTRYDECGTPYRVTVVRNREVKVPVKKVRPIVRYVTVCY